MNKRLWVVYLIRCSDESLYCGITNNLKNRLAMHNSGRGAKYTRSRKPVELVGTSYEMTKSEALKLEHKIKKLPADQKIAKLTRKENGMTISKKDLQALKKDIKTLEKKMEKLIATAEKKAVKPTATEQVLMIINRSKKGVNMATLMNKTGFNQKKITNILQRTYKQGKITRVEKGIYVGVE